MRINYQSKDNVKYREDGATEEEVAASDICLFYESNALRKVEALEQTMASCEQRYHP